MHGFELADAPDVAVTADTTLVLGGRRLVLLHPSRPAHTSGDLALWLPDERVLFAGDLLVEDGVTMVVDGSSAGLLVALDRLAALQPRVVVPGHGKLSERPAELIRLTRSYLEDLRSSMREAAEQGLSMNHVLARLPAGDENRPVSRPSRIRRNAVRVYLEMEREVMGFAPAAER
jgi:glyoxylase-like metal-dependent hydrolase (beta-lactamase superfamily II)